MGEDIILPSHEYRRKGMRDISQSTRQLSTVRNYLSQNISGSRVKQFTKEVKGSKPHPKSVIIQVTLNKLSCLFKERDRQQTSPGSDLYVPGGGVGLKND